MAGHWSSQLFYDGHQNFAQELAVIVDQEATAVSPSDRLMNIITIGLQHEHVHPVVGSGQHCQVVGAVNGPLPHWLHWCRLSGSQWPCATHGPLTLLAGLHHLLR
ncbi:uncharacterized protein LOC126990556 isoform X4 [Eriocheir sinensis]|uniref:uncharacterized protein LOC126990556 isoform X4 n=1 Tax=Eriocheir sinensis TaxID=95602 RepID=UPI0021C62A8A|nr:uncharacterized protein LOC126990556 isoform X4 [Eriocheir sinensis]